MSGLEAAASLFGSEDSNSDPFASLGSESQHTDAVHGASDDLFAANRTSSPAPDFLGEPQTYSEPVEQHNTWPETNSYEPAAHNVYSSPEQNYGTQQSAQDYGTHQSTQNHGEQWQNYSQNDPYAAPAYANGQASQAYNAYTPSQYGSASAANVYHTSPATTQSAYTPYAPPAQTQTYTPASVQSYNSYAPPVQPQRANSPQSYSSGSQPSYYPTSQTYSPSIPAAASPQTTYNSYAPPAQPSYGVPSYSSPQNSFGYQNASGAAVPPPPAPKAPLNRPKVSNAYDPPFPTTTSKKQSRHASSSSLGQYSSFSPPAQPSGLPRPPPGGAEQGHAHPPPSVPASIPYNKPPVMSSGYSSASNSRNGSIDSPPNGNGASATFSAYAPPTTNSYGPSAPVHNYAAPNQSSNMVRHDSYDSYADTQSENHNAPLGAEPEPISSSEASDDFFTGHSSSPPPGKAANQTPPSELHATGVHPETQPPPPPNYQSPPMGPPKRASSAAAIRAPVRTSSPLAGGLEFSRPRSSNAAVRTSPDSDRHRTGSFDLYSPKVGQIPEELTSNLPNGGSVDPYAPATQTAPQGHSVPSDPYAPNHDFTSGQSSYTPYGSTIDNTPRQSPPTSYMQSSPYTPPDNRIQSPPAMSSVAQRSPYDAKPPPPGPVGPPPPPKRSTSNASILSTSENLYAPSNHSRFQSNGSDSETYTSRYNYLDNDKVSAGFGPASSSSLDPQQEIKAPTYTPYAPSPSLLGTNDPLGRAGARVPVFSFGFGGKFVTCFHGADKMNTGFDVALASRNSTGVDIRTLNKLIPNSALNLSSASFPGPLFSDPGSPTTTIGLVRPGAAAQTKLKKAQVLKYLEDRATELSQGLGYLHTDTENQGLTESKIVLFKILKILVENDGKLSGTPAVDAAVREALVPQIVTDANDNSGFTSVADLQGSGVGSANPNETPISVTTLRPSALDKIESFLLRGERRQAYHFALDQKLWSHAMIIASGIDKEAWQEVVNEFLKTELGSHSASTTTPSTSGREGMRIVYSLFSGQGAKSVHQLVPKTSLSNPAAVLLAPMTVASTPLTPNFSIPMSAANIPAESLSKWTEIVAMMLSSSVTSETAATLTALGDQLAGNGWTEAAHVCYLLSPQTSTVAGSQHPSARIVLLGARNPHLFSNFMSDPDPIILSEIHEFALSLAPVAKGQEPFGGLPHLQAYRFIRAICLAELGDVPVANRYCEAITVSMNRPSAYYTPVLLERLKGLSDRIVGVSQIDKAGSWMGGKLAKPSLDGFGGWLEGRFAKLVTGDLESPKTAEHEQKSEERGFVGPFSQYSTISSTTTSTSPSPQSSVLNLNAYAPPPPPQTVPAFPLASNGPTERASSAMDNSRSRLVPPGPAQRVSSANASVSTFAQAQAQSRSFGQALSNYASSPNDLATPKASIDLTEDEGQEVSWWGSGDAVTPTAANFVQLSGNALTPSSEGFVSLMDNHSYSVGSTSHTPSNNHHVDEEEDVEDLGFGNSKPKPKSEADNANKPESKESKSVPARPDITLVAATSNSGSWLSRLWKREPSGPVKASLGEDSSFYYDAELKKWVNKKAGAEAAAKPATPPPPPARAQTTSPSVATGRPPSAGPPPPTGARPPSAGPPPPRASSAMENLSAKPPMRVRSNLVPSDEGGVGSAPSTPTGSRLAPPAPPPGRPKSQASKRNVRSRYVDVFSQEGGAP